MYQSSLRFAAALSSFLCVTAIPAVAVTQTRTPVTIYQPFRVPGGLLTPGRYEFSAIPGHPHMIEIRSTDGHMVRFVPAMPTTRMNRGTIVALYPSAAGSVGELASWYPDGGTIGFEFTPRGTGADQLSARKFASLQARVSATEKAAAEARSALIAAEAIRDASRTQEANAR
jgi:hypothetical protein